MAQKNSQTHKVEVKNFKEIYDYCYLNEIVDVNSFIDKCLKQGFDIQKYGMLGSEPKVETEVKVVEKIVEVIKEVQLPPKEIEVIKYVDREVIKEIPVEKIVTKIEYIYDKTPSELEEKNFHLEQELDDERQKFSTKTIEMENIFQNEMSKKDKELDTFRQTLDKQNNDNKTKMLENTLLNLRKELQLKQTKINELEDTIKNLQEQLSKNVNAIYLKGSNLKEKI